MNSSLSKARSPIVSAVLVARHEPNPFMRSLLAGVLLGATGVAFIACSSATSGGANANPIDAVSSICSKFVACGTADSTSGTPYTQSSCVSDFTGWVPPSGCADAIDSASCGTINGGAGSSTQAICFPSCSAIGATTCTGDSITLCVGATDAGATSGTSLVEECAATCSASGQTYTGVCGASYQGQVSASGQDTCWCNDGGDASVAEATAPSKSCQGTPQRCALHTGQDQCMSADGCSWDETCEGVPVACATNPDDGTCLDESGCSLNFSGGCQGTPWACTEVAPDKCAFQQGCRTVAVCGGTPLACSFQDESTCATVPGCSWE